MKERRLNELKGVVLVALGLMVLASLIRFERLDLPFYTSSPNIPPKNLLGIFGAYLGGGVVTLLGRAAGFFVPVLIFLLGIKFFQQKKPYLSIARGLGIAVLLISVSSLIGMFNLNNEFVRFYYSGFLGSVTSSFITSYFSRLGGFIIFTTLIILSLALVTEILISSLIIGLIDSLAAAFASLLKSVFKIRKRARVSALKIKPSFNAISGRKAGVPLKPKPGEAVPLFARPKIQIDPAVTEKELAKSKPSIGDFKPRMEGAKSGSYQLPSLDLLDSPPPFEARQIKEDLKSCARILEETLDDFGISAKVTDIERGPVITRYELEPAPGVKLNRIVALGDDIALAMKAQSVRVIAPIPGKGRVGVEVPNIQGSFVYLKEVFASGNFQAASSKLTLALGKDIAGEPIVAELDDMPHLLIAGTTGSGKTVCVNSLVLSLLFRASPGDLKFLMIDPKMVELMPFNGLPHLLCPVVTDARKASTALNWVVAEMEERYQLLARIGVRNIESYNQKKPEESIPYIIVIIDEFADLMSVVRDQIESAITRLAQLSRAVGIHLILATQRPSVDVITGVIKANLPARISFKVASKVDSRTVLDMNGADKLLGKGDMLFLRPGESKLIRIQAALVKDKEIERVVNFIKAQGVPEYDEEILKGAAAGGVSGIDKDEIYDQAVRVIIESNQASVSILQRRLRLGYTRAARIIDAMEQDGLVGPFEGSRPRKILVDREAWLEKDLMEKQEQKE